MQEQRKTHALVRGVNFAGSILRTATVAVCKRSFGGVGHARRTKHQSRFRVARASHRVRVVCVHRARRTGHATANGPDRGSPQGRVPSDGRSRTGAVRELPSARRLQGHAEDVHQLPQLNRRHGQIVEPCARDKSMPGLPHARHLDESAVRTSRGYWDLRVMSQRALGDRQVCDTHSELERLRLLPQHCRLERQRFRSHRRHGQLRELPQWHQGNRQGGAPHRVEQLVRDLSLHERVDARTIRSRGRHRHVL